MRSKAVVCLIYLLLMPLAKAQEKISFPSSDGLKITADLYLRDTKLPFIILLHQGGSSRGEYLEIAPKLLNLNYNCLAVDLRTGSKMNYVQNETAIRAERGNFEQGFLEAQQDIQAAIKYVLKYNSHPIVLVGSSFSASLSMIAANQNPKIKAVVAFSPGEFFRPHIVVKDQIQGLDIPLFISATELERPYVKEMLSEITQSHITYCFASDGKGTHGAKALWEESIGHESYWSQLLLFFKKIKD